MCDSRRPLNGADSEELPETPPQAPVSPVWRQRAVNGGWDTPKTTTPTRTAAATSPSKPTSPASYQLVDGLAEDRAVIGSVGESVHLLKTNNDYWLDGASVPGGSEGAA